MPSGTPLVDCSHRRIIQHGAQEGNLGISWQALLDHGWIKRFNRRVCVCARSAFKQLLDASAMGLASPWRHPLNRVRIQSDQRDTDLMAMLHELTAGVCGGVGPESCRVRVAWSGHCIRWRTRI
jgi:hypothetical protein